MKTGFTLMGILIGLGLAGGWFFTMGPGAVPEVAVIHASRGPAVDAVYATSTVEATVMLPIAARMTARLMTLNADEGQKVAKGEILARLEDSDLQKSLDELKAREVFIRKDYERKAALAKQGYETKAVVDQARAELDAIKAGMARVTAEASYTQLTAPADGTVIRRDGEIGQMIAANQTVFWLSCCAPLRISAEVDEEDIARVAPGQKVLIRADAFIDQIFHGTVLAITPKGDPVSRSYRVRIGFDDITPLRIGMTAENNIIIAEKEDVLLLENTAIDNDHVWIVDDAQTLQKRAIKKGIVGIEKTEVLEGITETDSIVDTPENTYTSGMSVTTRQAE